MTWTYIAKWFTIPSSYLLNKIPMSKIKRAIDFKDDMYHLEKSFKKAHAVIIKKLIDKECQESLGMKKK